MNWLVSALVGPILNFVWDKVILGAVALAKWIGENAKRKKIVEGNDQKAAVVEAIAAEIRALVREGKPVPPELEQRMLDASRDILIGRPIRD